MREIGGSGARRAVHCGNEYRRGIFIGCGIGAFFSYGALFFARIAFYAAVFRCVRPVSSSGKEVRRIRRNAQFIVRQGGESRADSRFVERVYPVRGNACRVRRFAACVQTVAFDFGTGSDYGMFEIRHERNFDIKFRTRSGFTDFYFLLRYRRSARFERLIFSRKRRVSRRNRLRLYEYVFGCARLTRRRKKHEKSRAFCGDCGDIDCRRCGLYSRQRICGRRGRGRGGTSVSFRNAWKKDFLRCRRVCDSYFFGVFALSVAETERRAAP